MEEKSLLSLIDESAKLEENVANIYLLLSKLYQEDCNFWFQLYTEELSHSNIFKLFATKKLPIGLFPVDILEKNLNTIRKNNLELEKNFPTFLSVYKRKLDAYRFAVKLEELATENIFQQLIIFESDSENLYLIQRINSDCINHKARIEKLLLETEESCRNLRHTD